MNCAGSSRPAVAACVALASFCVAFLAARLHVVPIPRIHLELETPNQNRYTPSYEVSAGQEIIMVYIGKASCAYCQAPVLPDYLAEIRSALIEQASRESSRFVAVAVALDWSPDEGYAHLRKFGGFDEIATGRSWVNSLAMKYIWDQLPGPAATPQVVVLRRTTVVPSRMDGGRYSFQNEHVVRRAVGLREVERLAKSLAGSPSAN